MISTFDLHTHLRGTLTPSLAATFAERNGVKLNSSILSDGRFSFDGFTDFLRAYDLAGAVVKTPEDLAELAQSYLVRCASQGTRYIEFMHSPQHSADNGIQIGAQLDAIGGAIEAASQHGILATVVVTAVRHRGPDQALELAEEISSLRNPVVSGFGLTGNEKKFDSEEFSGAFYVAADAGLGLTAHTGEWGDAASVRRTIDVLRLNRIGHGLSIVDDPLVLEYVAGKNIGIEVCLSSNVALSRVTNLNDHPIRRMMDAQCAVTLATDDPGYFNTTPAAEYSLARSHCLLMEAELRTINTNAIQCSFLPAHSKQMLLGRLKEE